MFGLISREDTESTCILSVNNMHFCSRITVHREMQEQCMIGCKLGLKMTTAHKITVMEVEKGDRNGGQLEAGQCNASL